MPLSNQVKNQHLMWRAGFGPQAPQLSYLQHTATEKVYGQLRNYAKNTPKVIDVADERIKSLVAGQNAGRLTEDERRAIRRQNRLDIRKLNLTWLDTMVTSEAQLREKMAFFWHGHFACRSQNILHQQSLLDVVRKHALGHFGDLLRAVSKSPAMLNFLNNNQNRKGSPNENFAREVMELFTMGRATYSEADVKEAARAFTGWGSNARGEFIFRKPFHDTGIKTIFGKQGAFDGDQVIDMLLNRQETAVFITKKIWRFFVSETENKQLIDALATSFYKNEYDIQKLMDDIFTSEWFYQPAYVGTRIKSPVELLAGFRRMLGMQFQQEDAQLLIQRILGQTLFYPPNVAGWPGGKNWIDTSSLMFRLSIPQLVSYAGEIQLKPKDDDDEMMGMKEQRRLTASAGRQAGGQIRATIQWDELIKQFADSSPAKLKEAIARVVLQTAPANYPLPVNADTLGLQKAALIKSVIIGLMSTPEYQLC